MRPRLVLTIALILALGTPAYAQAPRSGGELVFVVVELGVGGALRGLDAALGDDDESRAVVFDSLKLLGVGHELSHFVFGAGVDDEPVRIGQA